MQKHTQALSSYPGLAFRVDLNVPQFRGEVYNFLNLALPATLESLDLTYSHPRLVASSDEFARGLGRFQALKSLKFQLRFPVKEAVNFSTETFFLELRELTGLEELDLFFDNIDLSGEFAHGLSKLARLKSFRFILQRSKVLRQGPCSDKTLLQELAECTALETLDLSFGHGGLILDESFSATADKLVNLSYLRLGMEVGLHPKEFTGVLADALQQYPRLRHLSISGLCSLTCLRPLLFKRDSCLEALEVSMSGLEVTRDGTIAARLHATEAAPVVSLSGFESCGNNCNLHEFHLSIHNVEQLAMADSLCNLGSLVSLEQLSLNFYDCWDLPVVERLGLALVGLCHLKRLRFHASLSNEVITKIAGKKLGPTRLDVSALDRIKATLRNNSDLSNFCRGLCAASALEELELELAGCNVTANSLIRLGKALGKLPCLTKITLNFERNGLSNTSISEFEDQVSGALPGLQKVNLSL